MWAGAPQGGASTLLTSLHGPGGAAPPPSFGSFGGGQDGACAKSVPPLRLSGVGGAPPSSFVGGVPPSSSTSGASTSSFASSFGAYGPCATNPDGGLPPPSFTPDSKVVFVPRSSAANTASGIARDQMPWRAPHAHQSPSCGSSAGEEVPASKGMIRKRTAETEEGRLAGLKVSAQQALDTLAADVRAQTSSVHRATWARKAAATLLPWAVFAMLALVFSIGYWRLRYTAWTAFTVISALSAAVVAGVGPPQRPDLPVIEAKEVQRRCVGGLCLAAAVLGATVGIYDYQMYVRVYETYAASPTRQEVLVTESAGAFPDMRELTFVPGTQVDVARSLGYVDGEHLFCVAPVVAGSPAGTAAWMLPDHSPRANFWAAGLDCCKARGDFRCGDAGDVQASGGLVVMDPSPWATAVLPKYRAAVHEAAAAYGIHAPEDAVILYWSLSPEEDLEELWGPGVDLYVIAVLVCFVVSFPIGLLALARVAATTAAAQRQSSLSGSFPSGTRTALEAPTKWGARHLNSQ